LKSEVIYSGKDSYPREIRQKKEEKPKSATAQNFRKKPGPPSFGFWKLDPSSEIRAKVSQPNLHHFQRNKAQSPSKRPSFNRNEETKQDK